MKANKPEKNIVCTLDPVSWKPIFDIKMNNSLARRFPEAFPVQKCYQNTMLYQIAHKFMDFLFQVLMAETRSTFSISTLTW